MQPPPKEKDCARILIVEGQSDLQFYKAFLKHLGVLEGVFIKAFNGKSEVLKRAALEAFLNPLRFCYKNSTNTKGGRIGGGYAR